MNRLNLRRRKVEGFQCPRPIVNHTHNTHTHHAHTHIHTFARTDAHNTRPHCSIHRHIQAIGNRRLYNVFVNISKQSASLPVLLAVSTVCISACCGVAVSSVVCCSPITCLCVVICIYMSVCCYMSVCVPVYAVCIPVCVL